MPSIDRAYFFKALKYRALGLAIADNYDKQQMRCPIHLSIGQEYWLPFIGDNYIKGDRYFSSHRSHSLYMALGCDPKAMIAELHGHPDGCLGGRGGSMHLKDVSKGLFASTPIVSSSIPLATGSALASRHLSQNILTVSYFGDGACEEGAFHESLNLASVLNLPILFICENNQFSCNTGIARRQPSEKMTRFAEAHRIEYSSIAYTDDLMKTSNTIAHAFKHARKSPFFLEVKSNRMYQHCGHLIDLNAGDRSEEEQLKLNQADPISYVLNTNEEFYGYFKSEYHAFALMIQEYSDLNHDFLSNA